MPRILSVLLLAFALLLSPLAMIGGAGAAEAAPQAGSPMMHCEEYPQGKSHEKRDDRMGIPCAVACAAIPAAADSLNREPVVLQALALSVSGEQRLAGIRPERETPPPRAA